MTANHKPNQQAETRERMNRARAEKNWEALIEIGKDLLGHQEFKEAIECFIEARHLNKENPITHKHLGDAYLAMSQQPDEDPVIKEKFAEKAHICYQDALSIATDSNDEHFLREFQQEINDKDPATIR